MENEAMLAKRFIYYRNIPSVNITHAQSYYLYKLHTFVAFIS